MRFFLAVALFYPALMAWLYFVVLANEGAGRNPAVLVAFAVGKCFQFVLPVIAVALLDRAHLRPRRPTLRGMALGIGFGVIVAVGMLALYYGWLKHSSLASGTPEKVRGKLRELGFDSVEGFVLLASFIAIGHSLLEEYYWRWFAFGQLKRFVPFSLAVVVSSLGFMLHHIIVLAVYFPGMKAFTMVVIPFSLCVATGGGIWAWIYDRTGSFYAAWASHCLIDATIMIVGFDMVFRAENLQAV